MRVEKKDGSIERKILIGMVLNKQIISAISSKWITGGILKSDWANLVGTWAVDYFRKYGKPIKQNIETVFESWLNRKQRNKETISLVSKFLESLSVESDQSKVNVQFLIDQAAVYLTQVKLAKLANEIEEMVGRGESIETAEALITNYKKIELGVGAGIDVLSDMSGVDSVFDEESERLFSYPGAFGTFINVALARDTFLGFMAPEKRGKTWVLLDISWQAMLAKRKVAFFAVGDMSQRQMTARLLTRAVNKPLTPKMYRVPVRIDPPIDPRSSGPQGYAEVEFKEKMTTAAIDRDFAKAKFIELSQKLGGSNFLRLSVHPSSSISVQGIDSILADWAKNGWVADVVVIDYADILAPVNGKDDSRDQINLTWSKLRALSTARHCLVVTATQSDAASYQATTLGRANFSNDKRKFAHVNGMIGINCDEKYEKQKGLLRFNWIVAREWEYAVDKCVHVAGCLSIGRPNILSTF